MAELTVDTMVDGRYRIVDRIGSGGMAEVWAAEDTQLGRPVALKMLHRRFAQDAEFVERFRREASSAAGLQHPHVVNVFDRGEHDGTYYIAMEHLDGRSLKELISAEAPLQQERAIDLAIQILQAAGFAHRRGVIHRDFKPHNVIVDPNDHVKVTDFGIARAGASEMTETGSIMGTAQYLSPEQAGGQGVSEASDLYSIGVILFEMLAGRLPFEGDSAVAIAVKHLSEQPPALSQLRPDIHPGLEATIMRALAKDPAERWGSAEEFMTALQSVRAAIAMGDDSQSTAIWGPAPVAEEGAPEEESRWNRRRLLLALIPLLLLLVGGAWLLFFSGDQVRVPQLVGQQLDQAGPAVKRAGLELEVKRTPSSEPVDEVVDQDPNGGEEADEGSKLTLFVSSGLGTRAVPAVAGRPEAEAVKRLNKAGFKVDSERQPSTDVDEGIVIRTIPRAGTQRPVGARIQMFVSSGPRDVEVPRVVGLSRSSAESRLDAKGLGVVVRERESDRPENEVIDQDPSAGTVVDEGSNVTITVSKRREEEPEPDTARVPSVQGLTATGASARLRRAGFGVNQEDGPECDEGQDPEVVRQQPAAGTELRRGRTVTIFICRPQDGGGNNTE